MSNQNNIPLANEGNSRVKVILPAVALITSLYYSFSFTTAIVLGYFAAKLFCWMMGIDEHNGQKIFIDIGSKWKLHLHHWIMGIMVLALVWVIDYFYLPTFLAGFVCGVIIQDIYDYNDWHQVFIKNPAPEKAEI